MASNNHAAGQRRGRRTRQMAGVIGSLLALTGCAAYQPVPNGAPSMAPPAVPASPPPAPATATKGTIHLPLDTYQLSSADTATLITAIGVLTATCMRGKGFSYQAHPVTARQEAATPVVLPYGIDNPVQAARDGYSHAHVVMAGAALPRPRSRTRHSVAYWLALTGGQPPGGPGSAPPVGYHQDVGCVGLAAEQIMRYGWTRQDHVNLSLSGELSATAAGLTARNPRIALVEKSWSQCMGARGFNYPNTSAVAAAHWPARPSRAEKATAAADVTCKRQVNLPGIWLAVQAGYEQGLIAEDRAALASARRFLSEGIARARMILAARARHGRTLDVAIRWRPNKVLLGYEVPQAFWLSLRVLPDGHGVARPGLRLGLREWPRLPASNAALPRPGQCAA